MQPSFLPIACFGLTVVRAGQVELALSTPSPPAIASTHQKQ